ncbi:hypothetical protein OAS86_00265 [Gammaproteobacteria bacterium]|nr:hypothetical protein [Gammaproteobacteria bacterium]
MLKLKTIPIFQSMMRGRSIAMAIASLLLLGGCSTTKEPQVGPSADAGLYPELKEQRYPYDSSLYLDFVIPVFDPGLPTTGDGNIDYQKVKDEGIWPQLRRAEARRFAVETKRAIENLGTFGAVSVVPTATASGDVYLLGRVEQSDSEQIELSVKVLDSQGKLWGERTFEHTVSEGFFRDQVNEDKDSYEPVFRRIADYAYRLLIAKSEQRKQTIKQVTDIRYGQSYAPDVFGQYLDVDQGWSGRTEFELISVPDQDDAMVKRIAPLRVQDQLFIDRLQTQYEGFNARSDESYRAWQKETLPEIVAYREARWGRNASAGLGFIFTALAVMLSANSNSNLGGLGTTVGILASVYFANDALQKNAALRVHKQTLDEMGESLDLEIGPQLITHNDQTIELTGTANEQYTQWKNHLRKIYALETGDGDSY